MITREMFVEKLSKWLTPETCEALADYAETEFQSGLTEEVDNYEAMLLYLADFADANELQSYIRGMIEIKEDIYNLKLMLEELELTEF